MLMNKILRYSFVALLAMVGFGNANADVVDDLTASSFNITSGNSYADFAATGSSGAAYAAQAMSTTDFIQIRSKNDNSGVVVTTSVGTIKSITITYNAEKTGTNAGEIDVYAKNSAYSAPSDLYGDNAGDKVVQLTASSNSYTFTGSYAYFGIRSTNGARYIDKITIVWETSSSSSRENANLSFSETSVKARLGKPFTAPTLTNEKSVPVVYSSSNTDVAEVNAETGAVTLKAGGETTITAAVPESNTSYYGQASYKLTVEELATINTFPFSETFANTFGKFLVEDVSLADGLSYVWSKNGSYVKATAYANSTNFAAESWLVSPLFDLTNTNEPSFVFEHATNYFTDLAAAKQEVTVWVRIGEAGEWNQLVVAYPEELGWTFVSSGSVDLSEFIGMTIQIGFKYTSDAKAGTWEIKNFKVIDGQSAELAFSKEKASVILGAESPEYPTLTNPHNVTVTYSSSDTNVAEIDATTGAITPKADGKTTIKASFAGNGEYIAGEASYELTVIDESAKGRKGNPYTIAEVKALEESAYPADKVWVIGYIAGCAATGGVISAGDPVSSNILLTATAEFSDADELLPVALPNNATRTAVNIADNPTNVGKEVKVYGKIQTYFGVAGVKEVTSHEFTGNSVEINVISGIANITAAKAENGVRYNLAGQKVNAGYKGVVIVNGQKMLQK